MKLDSLLAPRSVAVVGASDDPTRVGGLVLANMLKGFAGAVTPVNPKRDRVQGLPAYPSIASMDHVPDLAIVVSPAPAVLQSAVECAELGVRAMIVISSGFAETGEEGQALQDQLAAITSEGGVSLLGPNCVGVLNVPISMRASFVRLTGIPMRAGSAAVVSQSGAFGLAIFEYAQERGLGVSYLCTTGNEAQLSCADLIDDLLGRPDVRVVMAYLEGIPDPDALIRAGERSCELGKPIVAMKVGGSPSGGRAAASHTAALAVSDRVIDAALDEAGIIRVRSVRQMLDYAKGFGVGRRPAGQRTVVFTGSGGVGVTMADAGEASGLDLAAPSPGLRALLRPLVPPVGSIANPIDHTAQILNVPENYDSLLRAVTTADEYDIVVIANVSRVGMPERMELLTGVADSTPRTVVAQSHYAEIAEELTRRGIPTVDDPAAAVETAAVMAHWERRRRERRALIRSRAALMVKTAPDGPVRTLAGPEAQELLGRYGLSLPGSVVADDEDAAVAAFAAGGRPVALKISADWMPHKSENGGVILGCRTEREVRQGFQRLRRVVEVTAPAGHSADIVVQDMVEPGLEFVCGALRDPVFGPLVSIGLGGVLVELLDDAELSLAPVTIDAASRMVRSLAKGRLVGHPRGISATQAEAIADIVVAVSNLVSEEPAVMEVDLNPVIVGPSTICPVDALVVVSAS